MTEKNCRRLWPRNQDNAFVHDPEGNRIGLSHHPHDLHGPGEP